MFACNKSCYTPRYGQRSISKFKFRFKDLTSIPSQVYTVAPVLFPRLIQLFQTETFGPGTRARVLSIFATFTTLISHMDSVDNAANENLLFPVLPGLVDTTIVLIGTPASDKIDYKLQTECVNFLSKLVQTFPKQMGDKVSYLQKHLKLKTIFVKLLV